MANLNNLSFNQDFSCISVATSKFYRIFNCDPFGQFYTSEVSSSRDAQYGVQESDILNGDTDNVLEPQKDNSRPTFLFKMLFSTSLTIIIPDSKDKVRKKLKIYNIKQGMKICELTFPSSIIDVKLSRERLCVILQGGQIYIYDLSCIRLIKVLEVPGIAQMQKICASESDFIGDLSTDNGNFLVFPVFLLDKASSIFDNNDSIEIVKVDKNLSSITETTNDESINDLLTHSDGWIVVYDTIILKPLLVYKAHESAVAEISISNDSSMIASASLKGTIIKLCHLVENKVGDTVGGARIRISKITNFRRGHHPAKINCLSFSIDGSILGCGSESKTIHLFRIKETSALSEAEESYHTDSEADDENTSSDDLNDNLASLLLTSRPTPLATETKTKSRFSSLKHKVISTSSFLQNSYTQSLMKNLPYKNYLNNLVWEPPRRSFCYIILPESKSDYLDSSHHHSNRVKLGFVGSLTSVSQVLVASYLSGKYYQYNIPRMSASSERHDHRMECELIAEHSLI